MQATVRHAVVPALKARGVGLVDYIIACMVKDTKPLPVPDEISRP
jgi:hypothetical protein